MYLYVPDCLITIQYVTVCTCLYCSLPLCTVWYHLVPPCTALYHSGTKQYIPVHKCTYSLRNFLRQYKLVCTGMYKKASGGTEIGIYTDAPVHIAWFRYTGFQMHRRCHQIGSSVLHTSTCQIFCRIDNLCIEMHIFSTYESANRKGANQIPKTLER